jgi:hypothetical protein
MTAKRPKPPARPARAPAFVAFRELRSRAKAWRKQARHWTGIGNYERAAVWLEAANDLESALAGLEGK